MSDPFEREKAIRRGELDDEMPSFEEFTGWFQRVPITYLPGLLVSLVQIATIRKVYQDGKLAVVVARAEATAGDYFREDQSDA